jgi:lysophospholipase L1-like esterase
MGKLLKRILIGLAAFCVLVVIAFGVTYFVVSSKAQKVPDNCPSAFLAGPDPPENKKILVCVGDSITHGRVSQNYVDMLTQRLGPKGFVVINAGINGELAYNVLQRLDQVIACKPDYVTVLIGTNDANAALSKENTDRAIKEMSLPQNPTKLLYRTHLSEIGERLKAKTSAQIAFLSLPPIGEERDNRAYKQAEEYSRVVQQVARGLGVTYLPLFETMDHYLEQHTDRHPVSYDDRPRYVMYEGIFLHYVFGTSYDDIARRNGFLLLTDHLHLNHSGAEMAADLAEGFVSGN